MESAGLTRFRRVLTEWARRYCEMAPTRGSSIALPTDFHPDEASGFLRARDAGL